VVATVCELDMICGELAGCVMPVGVYRVALCFEGYMYIVVGLSLKPDKLYSKYLIWCVGFCKKKIR
jgi:hypothetical protein